MPRVAACAACYKIERLPDPPADVPLVPATVKWDDHGQIREYTFRNDDGSTTMVPQYDPLLEDFVGRHGHGRPDSDMDYIKIFPVEQATWEKLDLVTEIKKDLANVYGGFWEEVDHYKTGALQCYNAHNNPDSNNRCIDFLDDSKRIGPKAPKKFQTYLCHVCPYMQTYLAQEARWKSGLYDPNSQAVQIAQRQQRRRTG